jgi:hypothetical protein
MTRRRVCVFWIRYRRDGVPDHVALEAPDRTQAAELARAAGFEPELVTRPPECLAGALEVRELETEGVA